MSSFFKKLVSLAFGKNKVSRAFFSGLSALIVFCVTYSLILPAITLDSPTAEESPGIEIEDIYLPEEDIQTEDGMGDFGDASFDTDYIIQDEADPDVYFEDGSFEDGAVQFENSDDAILFDDENDVFDVAEDSGDDGIIIDEDEVVSADPEFDSDDALLPGEDEEQQLLIVDDEVSGASFNCMIIRQGSDGSYYAMASDGAAVPVTYDAETDTASCEDYSGLIWTRTGKCFTNEGSYLDVTEAAVGYRAVTTEMKESLFVDEEEGKTSVYTKDIESDESSTQEYYNCLVMSEDETYFTVIRIDTVPVNRVIFAEAAAAEEVTAVEEEAAAAEDVAVEDADAAAEDGEAESITAEVVAEDTESIVEEAAAAEDENSAVESEAETIAEQTDESIPASETEADVESTVEEVVTSETETTAEEAAEAETESVVEEVAEAETESMVEEVAEAETESMVEEVAEAETESMVEDMATFSTESMVEEIACISGEMTHEGADYTVTVTVDESAGIPANAALKVQEILPGTAEYDEYYAQAAGVVADNDETISIGYARFFDICFVVQEFDEYGECVEREIEPESGVDVKISYKTAAADSAESGAISDTTESAASDAQVSADPADVNVLHFKEGNIDVVPDISVDQVSENETVVSFESNSFSVYGIVGTETLTTNYITAEGDTYTITVTYGKEAEIPKGATLEVNEIVSGGKDYTEYVEQAAKALAIGEEVPFVNAARLFDISIMADGKKVEPKAPVEVKIEYANAENLNETSEVGAVHFKESTFKTETEVMDVNVQGEEGKVDGVTFTTDSFSIYAVVIIDKEAGTFVVEDEDYKVTITYTKEANIPIGTELTVKEITPEEDRYWELREDTVEKINEGLEWEDTELTPDPRKGVTDAVFFDISLVNGGKEIEPDVPLQVKIEYKNDVGILVPDDEKTEIIHFAKSGTETIENVDVQYTEGTEEGTKVAVSYEYEQESFSEVGSYSTGEYIEINDNNVISPSIGIKAAPILRAAGDSSIAAEKTITDADGDGVYDLTLSVTGQSEQSSSTSVKKSNVVIVVDVSGSMTQNQTYSKYTGQGTTSGTYYGKTGDNYYRVYWRNPGGGYRWQYSYNNRYYDYTGDVYFQETRLAATKRALKELVSALLANNKDEIKDGVNLNDIIEITLVKFAFANEDSGGYGQNAYYYNGTSTLIRNVNTEAEETQIDTIIDNLVAGGGTNWERALQVAKTEADTYKRNQPDEAVSVIFMTDGVPTSWGTTNTAGSESASNTHTAWNEADDDARAIVSAGYTLYDIFAFGTDTEKYPAHWEGWQWVDPQDGGRTDADYLRSLTNYAYSGTGTYVNTTLSAAARPYFFNASDTSALQDAFNAIINSISGNVGYGGVMVDDGVTTGVTSTSVTVDGSVNTDKFKYSIKNGTTTLVTVHIEGNNATFTINGTDYPATGETVTTEINGTTHRNTVFSVTVGDKTYKMSPASFDNNGKIQWDLAGIGIIENGYTYELQFEVWPNQLSYDLVADLNNGIYATREEALATISDTAIRSQVDTALVGPDANGKYSIRTNYEQYVDYYTVDTQTNEQTGETITTYTEQPRKELGPKDPVDLTSSTMDLRKLWDDSLDQDQFDELLWKDITRNADGEIANQSPANSLGYSVKLHVWKADTLSDLNNQINSYADAVDGSYAQADEHDYLAKTLGWTGSVYDWSQSLEVAPGTMIEISKARDMGVDVTKHTQVTYGNKTYLVLESGHYYTVTEENIDRHFELNTIVYHPMLVDGVLSNVTFKEDGSVESIVAMSTVDATNTLKGGINVQKKVFDGEDHEVTEVIVSDDTFKVRITMNNADGTPYENWDYRIYYGQNNPNGTWSEANQNYGRTDHIYGSTGNGGIIETDLYIGDVIRVINVPAGVTYSVQETEYDDTVYTIGSNYTFPLTTGGEEKSFTTDGNGVSYMISKGENDNFVADSDKKVVGNAATQAVVVNKVPTARIKLLKVGDTTTPLDGIQFKIFYDEECTKSVTKDATGQAIPGMNSNGIITTDSEGYADLGTLAGTYYFQEIATKDGYNLLTAPVRVNVEKDGDGEKVTASSTQEGVIFNTPGWIAKGEDGIWVVKVNNSTGVMLPNTGGPGTILYTLSGIMLMLGAALMYGFRMRRRERRLS